MLKEGAIVLLVAIARRTEAEPLQADLHEGIGQLQVGMEWLKETLPSDARARRRFELNTHN